MEDDNAIFSSLAANCCFPVRPILSLLLLLVFGNLKRASPAYSQNTKQQSYTVAIADNARPIEQLSCTRHECNGFLPILSFFKKKKIYQFLYVTL